MNKTKSSVTAQKNGKSNNKSTTKASSNKSTTRTTNNKSTHRTSKHNSATVESFKTLLACELSDLLSAEQQIIDELPTMIKSSKSQKLKDVFKTHLKETRNQVTRLKKIFKILGEPSSAHKCKGMEGILKEGAEALHEKMDPQLRDAYIIGVAQRIEHYEIAGYGTARAHALQLGLDEVADLLKETLDEEANADKVLTRVAEGTFFSTGVNKLANEVEEEEYALAEK